jgi:hypothetical protein
VAPNQKPEFLAEMWGRVVCSTRDQSSSAGTEFSHSEGLHAVVFRLDIQDCAPGLNIFSQLFAMSTQAFLAGKTFRVQAHNSGQLGNSDQLFSGQIADPCAPPNWQYVVLAKTSETDRPLNYMRSLFVWTGRTLDWK